MKGGSTIKIYNRKKIVKKLASALKEADAFSLKEVLSFNGNLL